MKIQNRSEAHPLNQAGLSPEAVVLQNKRKRLIMAGCGSGSKGGKKNKGGKGK